MAYLISYDYERLIQDLNLQQIISGNSNLKTLAEQAATAEIKSYLRAKYDVESEFTNTTLYSNIAIYKAANRVYLDATAYSASATYSLGDLVLQAGSVYRNIVAITVGETFTPAKWELLGLRYGMYYAVYPKPVFNINAVYEKDDEVFWKDKVYVCQIATQSIDHAVVIQYPTTYSIPYQNVFPDDVKNGEKYWGTGTSYTIPAGSILSTTYFAAGDNRNQQLVLYLLDMIIYHLYRRIPPAIVPEIRILAYQTAISWLKNVSKGEEIVADITKLQPPQGGRILWGSVPKHVNSY